MVQPARVSYIENGARPSLIPLIASFLENRRMRVKWHGKESSERSLPGSSPQGSNFGILEYLSQSNDNASTVPIQDKFKWMDDLSILEIINDVHRIARAPTGGAING